MKDHQEDNGFGSFLARCLVRAAVFVAVTAVLGPILGSAAAVTVDVSDLVNN